MNRERRKRVALFVPSLRGGGAERMMLNLAGEFAERGAERGFDFSQGRRTLPR